MTIGTDNAYSGPYLANGSTTVFPFTFEVLDPDWVSVLVRDSGGADTIVSPSLYSVSLTGSAPSAGSVALNAAPASGSSVYVYLDPAFDQTIGFENGSAWTAKPVNDGYDAATQRTQALRRDVERAILTPMGEAGAVLPPSSGRAGKFLAFDALGNLIAASGSGEDGALRADIAAGDGAALIGFSQPGGAARSVLDRLRETYSVKDFGAVGDGVADDTTPINNGTAAVVSAGVNGDFVLSGTYKVTSWSNPYGIRTTGPGKIVTPITGGVQQLSTYSDCPGSYVYGTEYLDRVVQRLKLGASGSSGQIGCFLYGDSTVAGGYMSMSTVALLQRMFQVRGIGNIAITNRGVAGTTVSSLNVLADLSATTDLAIIKYGINDGGNPEGSRLATFQTTLDSKLTAIRAEANGGRGNLAIVLVGPNATADTPNGRDERWYEQLRGIYIAAARKHKCAYVDVYGAMRDARGGATVGWDDPYGDGRTIHPTDSVGARMWSLVVDAIIPSGWSDWWGSSNFRNVTNTSNAPSASAAPSLFLTGIDHARATVGNGWPREGFVVANRNPDQGSLQILYPFGANDTRMMIRTANTGADTWNRWTSAPENLTLANSWVAAGTVSGTTYATPSAYVDVSGTVHLRGGMKSGTTTVGTKVASVPTGMAPASDTICTGTSSTGTAVAFKVATNGDVTLFSAGDATVTSLDGIRFLAA